LDVRLFKALVFLAIEAILWIAVFIFGRFAPPSELSGMFVFMLKLMIVSAPVFFILPEDNWIWLVEESPRGKKIALRNKASKHLHLSMLYIFGLTYFPFMLSLSLMVYFYPHPYMLPLTWPIIAASFLYGVYSAWKNSINVRKHESLFAVAWDLRAFCFEIFVGIKAMRGLKFYYSGIGLLAGLLIFATAASAPFINNRFVSPLTHSVDMEKRIVMTTMFHIMISLGVWSTTMYLVFQAFFSRRMEDWAREPRPRPEMIE